MLIQKPVHELIETIICSCVHCILDLHKLYHAEMTGKLCKLVYRLIVDPNSASHMSAQAPHYFWADVVESCFPMTKDTYIFRPMTCLIIPGVFLDVLGVEILLSYVQG